MHRVNNKVIEILKKYQLLEILNTRGGYFMSNKNNFTTNIILIYLNSL